MENKIEVKPIEIKEIQEQTKDAEQTVITYKNMIISEQEEYNRAGECLKQVKLKVNELEAKRKKITKPLDIAKKAVMDLFLRPTQLLAEAEGIIKQAMLRYQQEQEEKRKVEERRLQELAKREEERLKKALDKRIENAKARGNEEKAEELEQKKEEVYIPTPVVASQVEKVQGVNTMKVWKHRVFAPHLVPRNFMMVDEQKLRAFAKATKGTEKVEGVEFYFEETISSRSI